jgi:HSP20 family molecular chaperone IbpA
VRRDHAAAVQIAAEGGRTRGGGGRHWHQSPRGTTSLLAMGEDLITTLSMENAAHHGPCTLLSMDPTGHLAVTDDRAVGVMVQALLGGAVGAHSHAVSPSGASPPDINQPWQTDLYDMLGVGLAPQVYTAEAVQSCAPKAGNRKAAKRSDSIWAAWFFFTFYFKPLLSDRCKDKVVRDANGVSGFEKSDLLLDMFLVQHDMENMYMWVFKERPENALGKMQLRSYMNGHQRPGEPQFPFSVDRGFVRSHRMQRKHYRGLSNPQCIHGIEVVRSPNLAGLTDADLRRWADLTGRDVNFVIPQEASDFGTWRTVPNSDLEIERPHPAVKSNGTQNQKKLLNGSGLNLSSPSNHSGEDGMDLSPVSSKRRKEGFPHAMDEEGFLPLNSCMEKTQQNVEMHSVVQPSWLHEFTGVMTKTFGPVTAAKSIYEDDKGYLIMVSLPFVDQQRVKVSWRNSLTHGIVKIICTSTARMPQIRRHGRAFKLADPSPEHCPPGDFIREIPLASRIPEGAMLEAYFDEAASVLEIMVPKRGNEPEEHEVRVSLRPPHFGANEILLT